MADRVRVGVGNAGGEIVQHPLAHPAVIGGELGEAEGVLLVGAEDDVDQLGLNSLDSREQLAVEAELEDEVGLGATRELGVGDLVAPLTEIGGAINSEKEVGVTSQVVIEEGRLVDHLGAGSHCLDRVGCGSLEGLAGACRPE